MPVCVAVDAVAGVGVTDGFPDVVTTAEEGLAVLTTWFAGVEVGLLSAAVVMASAELSAGSVLMTGEVAAPMSVKVAEVSLELVSTVGIAAAEAGAGAGAGVTGLVASSASAVATVLMAIKPLVLVPTSPNWDPDGAVGAVTTNSGWADEDDTLEAVFVSVALTTPPTWPSRLVS